MKVTADCDASPEYKNATIRMNSKELSSLSNYDIIATAAHELMHCVVWPLGSWADTLSKKDVHKQELSRHFEETVVTSLERIILPLTVDQIRDDLIELGYDAIDVVFEEVNINHEK